MMRDHHDDAPEGAAGRGAAGDRPMADRRPADREVPLPAFASADGSQAAIHAWLDGEASEAEAHGAAADRVRFWRELTVQVEVHRTRSAPASLLQAVMAALPSVPPAAQLADMPKADAPATARPAAPRHINRAGEAPR
ncbi:MAG: hypothetical protein KJT01_13140 [Gemmatimonadetes bacterium]|nr:hypothetical protein [Gemmatimonadota bacterium]